MTIPTFRRSAAPARESRNEERVRKRERYRGSRQERGYDAEWVDLRDRYMVSVKGQCEECRRRGYLTLAHAIDHIIPLKDDPSLRLSWDNLQALCRPHHHGWKARIEDFARKIGAIRLLPQWCRFPETRPAAFAIVKRGPLAELFDAEEREAAESRGRGA